MRIDTYVELKKPSYVLGIVGRLYNMIQYVSTPLKIKRSRFGSNF